MGKYGKYSRKYQKNWESEDWAKGWLRDNREMPNYNCNDSNEAYCLYCHTSLRAHAADLKKHALSSKKHIAKAKAVSLPKKATLIGHFQPTSLTNEQKIADLKMSLFIVHHSSIRAMDHLGETIKALSKGSVLENIRIHRTKCACLIKNVLSPAILEEIICNVGSKRYGLIIDESTDVSVVKYMALCIRYFSEVDSAIVTDFLGLITIERATAEDLYESLKNYLIKIKLPLKNMLAIGTDGASNLCGQHNSLYTRLKGDVPDLILLKCTCHSIHLCVSKASETLPSSLDFLAREIFNWFSNSPLRRIQYRKIFDLINLGENKKFKNFVKLSATRWLSRYEVIKRILEHWLELKTFFEIAGINEKCYTASTIHNMLNDERNFCYFTFLKPILADMNQLNLSFQSDMCDIGSSYFDLKISIESLARRIIKPSFLNHENKPLLENITKCVDNELAYLDSDASDLGYDFSVSLSNSKKLSAVEKNEIQRRCGIFLKSLLAEMMKRLPSNINILYSKVQLLNPINCTKTSKQEKFHNLPISSFILPCENYDLLENQWRKLPSIEWADEFGGNLPNNILEFWPKVFKFNDGALKSFFKELSTVVLRLLSIPISNAVVERVFSIMNIVKTKNRNRMNLDMLESIIRIRIFMKSRKKCCNNFEIPTGMLLLFNSNMYETTSEKQNETDEAISDDLEVALEITKEFF